MHGSRAKAVYRIRVPSVQVKEVPDEVHLVLRQRAAAAGQSLQEYLLALFTQHALTPTLDEVLNRIEQHSGGSLPLAASALAQRTDRPRRP
jgi:plasmid stability protein